MKNLKKLLSLVLVLIMVMSLFPAASAADLTKFSDLDDVGAQFVEAIDVMVSLGIIEGRTATELIPQGEITRAEITKIATYLKTGKAAADRLVAQPTQFTDVPASHWASKYVAYLAETGIVAGRGDGTFDPEAPVTGVEIGKILLGTLGYGVKDEFVGANWALNVVSRASAVGIFTLSVDIDLNAPATREQVMLYAFNTLKTDNTVSGKNYMVEYNEFLQNYIPSGESAWNQISEYKKEMYIGYRFFNLTRETYTDALGFVQRFWAVRSVKVSNDYLNDFVIKEFTIPERMTKTELAVDYTWGVAGATEVVVYTNGVKRDVAITAFANRGSLDNVFGVDLVGAKAYFIGIPGGIITKVIIVYETLAQVTRINAAAKTINLDVFDPTAGAATGDFNASKVVKASNVIVNDPANYAVDDYVLVTLYHGGAAWNDLGIDSARISAPIFGAVTEAKAVTGTMKSYTRATSDNTNIYLASVTTDERLAFAGFYGLGKFEVPTTTNESVFYLDSNGNVIGWEGDSSMYANMSYLYVNEFAVSHSAFTGGVAVKASVTFGDTATNAWIDLPVTFDKDGNGSVRINTVPVVVYKHGDATFTESVAKAALDAYDGWYSYSKNTSNMYALNSNAGGATKVPGAIVQDSIYDFISFDNRTHAVSVVGANFFTAKTVGFISGRKYTGNTNFPRAEYNAGGVSDNFLTVRSPLTNEVLVTYYIGNAVAVAKPVTYAMVITQPYGGSYLPNSNEYFVVGNGLDDALFIDEDTPPNNWDDGTVLVAELNADGKYIIDAEYRSTTSGDAYDYEADLGGHVTSFVVANAFSNLIYGSGANAFFTDANTVVFDAATNKLTDEAIEAGDTVELWVNDKNVVIYVRVISTAKASVASAFAAIGGTAPTAPAADVTSTYIVANKAYIDVPGFWGNVFTADVTIVVGAVSDTKTLFLYDAVASAMVPVVTAAGSLTALAADQDAALTDLQDVSSAFVGADINDIIIFETTASSVLSVTSFAATDADATSGNYVGATGNSGTTYVVYTR